MSGDGFRLTRYESTPVYVDDVEIGRMVDWRSLPLSDLLLAFHRVDLVEQGWKQAVAECANHEAQAKLMSKALDQALKPLWSPAPGVKHKLNDNERRELVNRWVEKIVLEIVPTLPASLKGLVPAADVRSG